MTQPTAGWPGAPGNPPQQGGADVPPPPPPHQPPTYQPSHGYQQPSYPPSATYPPSDQVVWGAPISNTPAPGQWDDLGPQTPSTRLQGRRGRGRLIASLVAVIALAGGGTATYLAMSDKNTNGTSSPKAAIQSIVSDLNKSDLVAALDDLPPGERTALAGPFTEDIAELKRLGVLSSSANASKLSGVTFDLTKLTYASSITVNDHVQIVQITGGSLDVSADAAKIPFTSRLLHSMFPNGLPASSHGAQHVDLATQVKQNGKPLQLAAEKVGGKWYPSLFYTVAAAATRDSGKTVSAADYIPAVGASSAEDAVSQEIRALIAGDYTTAITLLSPDELAVMHDYGGLLVRGRQPRSSAPFTVKSLAFNTKNLSGGAVRLTLKSVSLTVDQDGEPHDLSVAVDGSCYTVTTDGQVRHLCASDLISAITSELSGFGLDVAVTPAQHQALVDLFTGFTSIGIDATQSGGRWYVSPVRSYLEITTSVLASLKDNDLFTLIGLFQGIGH